MDMNIKNTTAVNIACPALEWQGLALTFNVKARPCHSRFLFENLNLKIEMLILVVSF